jgi:hypothetical protein
VFFFPSKTIFRGLLTGKYKRNVKPTEGRIAFMLNNALLKKFMPRYLSFDDKTFDIIETAESIAKQKGKFSVYFMRQ